jgi:WSC domain
MTVDNCKTAALNNGLSMAGVEYGGECWAGSKLNSGSGPAPDGEVGCNMACKGSAPEMCGGSNRISLYLWNGPLPTVTAIPPPPPNPTQPGGGGGGGGPTTTAIPATPTQNPNVPAGWTHQGCWQDNVGPYGRTLFNQQPDVANLTQASCVRTCAGLGYSIAGMEYYTQCFCDNYIRNSAALEPLSDCNAMCSGNTTEQCGGPNRLTIFSSQIKLSIIPPPKINMAPGGGNWKYGGCLIDNKNQVRAFSNQIILQTNNTADTCLGQCAKYGYAAGGMEWGQECCKPLR